MGSDIVAMQTSEESLGELLKISNLRYSYEPVMPDVYMPYQGLDELP